MVVLLSLMFSVASAEVSNSWFSDQANVDVTISSNWEPEPDVPIQGSPDSWELVRESGVNYLVLKEAVEYNFIIEDGFEVELRVVDGLVIDCEVWEIADTLTFLYVVVVPAS